MPTVRRPGNGLFDGTNPTVKCTGYSYRTVEEAPLRAAEPKR